ARLAEPASLEHVLLTASCYVHELRAMAEPRYPVAVDALCLAPWSNGDPSPLAFAETARSGRDRALGYVEFDRSGTRQSEDGTAETRKLSTGSLRDWPASSPNACGAASIAGPLDARYRGGRGFSNGPRQNAWPRCTPPAQAFCTNIFHDHRSCRFPQSVVRELETLHHHWRRLGVQVRRRPLDRQGVLELPCPHPF